MKQQLFLTLKISIYLLAVLFTTSTFAQNSQFPAIDWAKDTIPRENALAAKSLYVNNLRGHALKGTENINLPVDKLKAVMDACAANSITDISVAIITIRQNDVVFFRNNNPDATDAQLTGSQMLVFKVPRRAFGGAVGAKINTSNSPLMMSLLAAGLIILDKPITELPFGTGDVYLSFGSICPPPASCTSFN